MILSGRPKNRVLLTCALVIRASLEFLHNLFRTPLLSLPVKKPIN